MKLLNPIIPGFHPDPSICRVGSDYYLVTSSFEYFPGVPIFHSRDLHHWRQIGHCLTRLSQLPLANVPSSGGIYAPTIRHHNGRFYMVTTNVNQQAGGRVTRSGNFYVYSDDPAGPWSEPIRVEQKGIDPSLWFEESGVVYFTSNGTAWAPRRGLYQCEIDIETGRQLTDTRLLWTGTGGAYVEAPHLFNVGGYYYLLAAEGGTERCHMATIARSHNPYGPFEHCPHNPILTHRSLDTLIQSTGHADFVQDPAGNWWAVFLGVRFPGNFFHVLGRETFLAPITWTSDGWPIVNGGERVLPEMEVASLPPAHPWPARPPRDEFEAAELGLEWNFLRNPSDADWSLSERPGSLILRCAAHTLDDLASPAFLGRRQEHFEAAASTLLDFTPAGENEEAGITAYMNDSHHCELAVTRRQGNRVVLLRRRVGTMVSETVPIAVPDGPLTLTIAMDRKEYRFAVATSRQPPQEIGRHEVRYLSTEVAGGYTGVYLGLYATARGAQSATKACFDWFDYRPAP